MKKDSAWLVRISIALVALSALVYAAHILIFRDPRHTFFYLVEDMGFLFINVLLVIVLIERLLARREKQRILKKLNMVIGTFFSEVGLELLRRFSAHARNVEDLSRDLSVQADWTHKDFQRAADTARRSSYDLAIPPEALDELKTFLQAKRSFLVLLLENPNLLEHDRFTDLLWAVFHLAEELSFRQGPLAELPASDTQHLMGDAKRAYAATTAEWITYVEHLKNDYPFLFSLAARVNPFGAGSSAVVR